MKAVVGKNIYTKKDLQKMGFTKRQLDKFATSDRFSEFGFRMGSGRTSTVYFNLTKLERFIETQQDEGRGVFK